MAASKPLAQWRAELSPEHGNAQIVADDARRPVIADVLGGNRCFDDARLLASAPDLHAALITAKQEMWLIARHQWTMGDFKNWAVIQQIDAALQKADGKQRVPA